ncbi:hypothetical protein [Bartonella grahamii]|uniref:hypothetical protein n=1 Tax=Bartonella grahamii TaxID=33045 RepID=UPI00235ECB42|nr:hypothetical protein [Bartonella grahamii]
MCWSVRGGCALLGVTWTVALVCGSSMDLALEKRGVLSHGGFSLNDLMREVSDGARCFVFEGIGIFLHCGLCLCGCLCGNEGVGDDVGRIFTGCGILWHSRHFPYVGL